MPITQLHVVIGERALVQRKGNLACLTRLQFDFCKTLQLPERTDDAALHIADIELHRFFAGSAAGVLNGNSNLYSIRILDAALIQQQIAVLEFSVAQPEAEREQRLNFFFIVITVADKQPFLVLHLIAFAGEVQERRIVAQLLREGLRQFAAGAYCTEEQIGNRAAKSLSAQIAFQHRFGLRKPWHFHR
ncbi:hypothetical protein D3C75_872880 [compost metagenome]